MSVIEEIRAKIAGTEYSDTSVFIPKLVQLALFAEQNYEFLRDSCGVTDTEILDCSAQAVF